MVSFSLIFACTFISTQFGVSLDLQRCWYKLWHHVCTLRANVTRWSVSLIVVYVDLFGYARPAVHWIEMKSVQMPMCSLSMVIFSFFCIRYWMRIYAVEWNAMQNAWLYDRLTKLTWILIISLICNITEKEMFTNTKKNPTISNKIQMKNFRIFVCVCV